MTLGQVGRAIDAGLTLPAAEGELAGAITIGEDFEFSDAEIEALLDDPE